jgi:hypothetical protein
VYTPAAAVMYLHITGYCILRLALIFNADSLFYTNRHTGFDKVTKEHTEREILWCIRSYMVIRYRTRRRSNDTAPGNTRLRERTNASCSRVNSSGIFVSADHTHFVALFASDHLQVDLIRSATSRVLF